MSSLSFFKKKKQLCSLLRVLSLSYFSNVPALVFSISDDFASLILYLCSVGSCLEMMPYFLMCSVFLIFLLTCLQKFFESRNKNGLFQKGSVLVSIRHWRTLSARDHFAST